MVYVCSIKDIECGDRSENWCASCPKRTMAQVPPPGAAAVTHKSMLKRMAHAPAVGQGAQAQRVLSERQAFEAWRKKRYPTLTNDHAVNLMRDAWLEARALLASPAPDQGVRMLTEEEVRRRIRFAQEHDATPYEIAAAIQRKFIEVNGLTLKDSK